MTSRSASCGSRWIGIILLLISVSLVESQAPLSLDSPLRLTVSGNTTVLHKLIYEGNVLSSALNDGERKSPFQSSTTPASSPSEWIKNSSTLSINEEQHLPTNQNPVESSPIPDVQSLPVIDFERPGKPDESEKHLIEKLIANSHTQIQDNKREEIALENPKHVSIPEFNQKDEYPDIEDNVKLGDKEPTTPKPKIGEDEMISLINDTNVNYRGLKKEHVDDVITKNLKITHENATNLISREPDVESKPRDSKSQVEIIKNIISPKVMRIIEPEEFGQKIEKNQTTPPSSTITPELTTESTKKVAVNISGNLHEPIQEYIHENIHLGEVYFDSKKLQSPGNRTHSLEKNTTDGSDRNTSPKGRTISFNDSNQFSSAEVEAIGLTKESVQLGFTKEVRPYRYLLSSTTKPVNSSKLRVSTEEISPLENTIGRSPDDKKIVITESSVVIDNSIQQMKLNIKRSGNSSRMSNANATSPVTSTSESLNTSEATEGLNSQTTSAVLENTRDPQEEIPEKKNSLDENVLADVNKNTTESQESRATEENLVQNTTEASKKISEIETTEMNPQMSIGDSMLMVSPLNATEDSTKSPPMTQIKIQTNPPESTPNPINPSPSVTTATEETSGTTVEEVDTTTVIPETVPSVDSGTERLSTKTESTNVSGRGVDSESTTSGVEYEFIGLTETTSESYVVSSEGVGIDVSEFASTLRGISSTSASTIDAVSSTSSIIHDSTNRENVTASSMREDDGSTTDSITEEMSTMSSVLDTTIYTTPSIDISKTDGTTVNPEETTFTEIRAANESRNGSFPDLINSTNPSMTTTTKINTIISRPDDKKLVITESSVVIDNSIQQMKPNIKRSGNSSRMSNANATSPVISTSESLNTSEATEGLNSQTASVVLENTRDPQEEIPEKKNSLDENVLADVNKNTTESQESRATEVNLVQNTTEASKKISEIETTEMNPQMSIGDSMLMVSPLNATEDSTKSPPMTQIKIQTNPPESTLNPIDPSPSVTTATEETSGTTVEEVNTTTVIPETVPSVDSGTERLSTKTESTNVSGRGVDTESTTSGVEYEFIGLTETTSESYVVSSEGVGIDVSEFASTLRGISSTSASTIDAVSSTSSITHDSTDRENVTASSMREDDGSTTDSITEEMSTMSSVFDTTIYTTPSIDISETDGTTVIPEETTFTEIRAANESRNGSFSDLINSTNSSMTTTTKINTSNPEEESSTGPSTFSSVTVEMETSEDSTTVMNTEGSARGVTEQPFTPEDVNLLVKIVVEGTWNDVCPHLPALRQSIADLLTAGIEKMVYANQIIFQKNPCTEKRVQRSSTELALQTLYLYVVDQNGNFDASMTRILPTLYNRTPIKSELSIRSFQLVQDADSGNAIAVVVVSCVAFICLVLLAGLLFIMRKRQTRFNYGERCRPVSLDAFSFDSVSAYNSVRRKGANRASKRSYGNPTFEDSTTVPSHPLNFSGLSAFCNEQNAIYEEYSGIPQVSAKIDELPPGAEVKNRFANVVPLPETRVPLAKINNDPLSEYINASYVRGPKNATKYYIACQAPIESTVTDFWRMIWEQQSKVIIMLTDLIENGVEKCAEYMPPSEVTDCHRLFGDYQVTLKKRETKEKYAISTLHLKNLENNTYREISHIWYLWPANGVQTDAAGLIAVLLEARALHRGDPVPIVIHCSPGTGRTGTLIALDLGIRQYEITRTVDVPRVVYTIRRDRAGAVQTKEQYAFIYKALNLYATKLAGGGLEST